MDNNMLRTNPDGSPDMDDLVGVDGGKLVVNIPNRSLYFLTHHKKLIKMGPGALSKRGGEAFNIISDDDFPMKSGRTANVANGFRSHAEGIGTQTTNDGEHAEGKYNVSTEDRTIHSVGIGTDENSRKNAIEIANTGDIYIDRIGGYNEMENPKSLQEVLNEGTGGGSAVTTKDITVQDGPLAKDFGGNGTVIAAGFTMDQLVEKLVAKEIWPRVSTTVGSIEISYGKPSFGSVKSIAAVGEIISGNITPGTISISKSTNNSVTGLTYGYSTDKQNIINSNSIVKDWKTNSDATGALESSKFNITIKDGDNIISATENYPEIIYTIDSIPAVYIVSNTKLMDESHKTREISSQSKTFNKKVVTASYNIQGVYPIYTNGYKYDAKIGYEGINIPADPYTPISTDVKNSIPIEISFAKTATAPYIIKVHQNYEIISAMAWDPLSHKYNKELTTNNGGYGTLTTDGKIDGNYITYTTGDTTYGANTLKVTIRRKSSTKTQRSSDYILIGGAVGIK